MNKYPSSACVFVAIAMIFVSHIVASKDYIPDQLLPSGCAEREAYFQSVLDLIQEDGIDFEIKHTARNYGGDTGYIRGTTHSYQISYPDYAQVLLDKYKAQYSDDEVRHHYNALFYQSLFTQQTSCESAILILGLKFTEKPAPDFIKPLLANDRDGWRKDFQSYGEKLSANANLQSYDHYRSLFIQLLPENVRADMVKIIPPKRSFAGERVQISKYSVNRKTPLFGIDEITPLYLQVRAYIDAEGDGSAEIEAFTPRMQLLWSAFLLSSTDDDALLHTKKFFNYAKEHSKQTDLFVDWANALLITRGYSYDASTGQYEVNQIGLVCMKYIEPHMEKYKRSKLIVQHILTNLAVRNEEANAN